MKIKANGMWTITMVMVMVFAGLTASGIQAEIYSWTDENGVKHYSHTPPRDRSGSVKASPEIETPPATEQNIEKINEENIDAILEALDREKRAPAPPASKTPGPISRQERIQKEKQKLEDKITWLEQLPPQAYANTRSKQAIIGRYRYRMQQLRENPDAYFEMYGD